MSTFPGRWLGFCLIAAAGTATARGATPAASPPATQPVIRPALLPASRLATPPASRPATPPASRPAVRPAVRPEARPAAGPASRPAASRTPADVKQSVRRLWQESVTPPEMDTPPELKRMLAELRALRLSRAGRARAAGASRRPVGPTSRPTPAATQPATTQPTPTSQPAAPGRTLPAKVLAQLKGMPAANLSRPVDLADDLFRAGYLDAAFTLYEKAGGGGAEPATRAWALYQMANCRRTTDAAAAETLYHRVAIEHASTPWAEPAATEEKLLQWQRLHQPLSLLKDIERIGRSRRPAATQPAAAAAQKASPDVRRAGTGT